MDRGRLTASVGCDNEIQEHPMIAFQSPTAELQLAKAVREADIEAAKSYRLGRLVRKGRRAARIESAARSHDARLSTLRAPRPTATQARSRQPSG
jgi:hypothetical protein